MEPLSLRRPLQTAPRHNGRRDAIDSQRALARLIGAGASAGQRSDSCPLRNKLSVLECVQKSSCTLRLQLQLIDFQPGSTSTEPYATGLKPTRVLGAPAVGGGETSNKTSARRRSCSSGERRRCFTGDARQGWSGEFFLFVRPERRRIHFRLFTRANDSSCLCSLRHWGDLEERSIGGERSKAERRGHARPGELLPPLISTHLKVADPRYH